MDYTSSTDPTAAQQALDTLASHLGDPEFQDRLKGDPEEAARGVGITTSDLPPGLLTTVAELSSEEMGHISSIHGKLLEGLDRGWIEVAIFF